MRKARGLTLAQVSARIGVHTSVVANWERGERVPQVDRVGALARLLGVRPAELTGQAQDGPESLQWLRVNAGLLQGQLAARAGLTRTKYAALEQGVTLTISDTDCAVLGDVLGVEPAAVRAAQAVSRAAYLAR